MDIFQKPANTAGFIPRGRRGANAPPPQEFQLPPKHMTPLLQALQSYPSTHKSPYEEIVYNA